MARRSSNRPWTSRCPTRNSAETPEDPRIRRFVLPRARASGNGPALRYFLRATPFAGWSPSTGRQHSAGSQTPVASKRVVPAAIGPVLLCRGMDRSNATRFSRQRETRPWTWVSDQQRAFDGLHRTGAASFFLTLHTSSVPSEPAMPKRKTVLRQVLRSTPLRARWPPLRAADRH